jgi:multidrug efflux system membrane fusion protein
MSKKIIVFSIIVILFGSILLMHRQNLHNHENLPIAVKVASVVTKPMPIVIEAPGTIEASKTVNIRAQITGTLKKIDFIEGQYVEQGQPLFEIDSQPYQVKLTQAQASLTGDEAQLKSLNDDLARYTSLFKMGYVTKQEVEQEQAKVKAEFATVQVDRGNVNDATINLQYSKILAPIAGKTGNISVKEGDLITAASANPLVIVSQMNPILVDFNLPQDKVPEIIAYQNKGPLAVEVWNDDKSQKFGIGTLTFIDNGVDKTTGTVLLKASLDNPKQLLPGLLVNVKLVLAIEPHALVIPVDAVKIGQYGNYVYVVKDNKAAIAKIKVLRRVDNLAVITGDVVEGDKVITVASPDLDDGSVINY